MHLEFIFVKEEFIYIYFFSMYVVNGPCGFFGCVRSSLLHRLLSRYVSGVCSLVEHGPLIAEASPVEEHGLQSTQASVVVAPGL